jgi:hypothetical protein
VKEGVKMFKKDCERCNKPSCLNCNLVNPCYGCIHSEDEQDDCDGQCAERTRENEKSEIHLMCEVYTLKGLILCTDLRQACDIVAFLKTSGEPRAKIRGKYRVIIEENS